LTGKDELHVNDPSVTLYTNYITSHFAKEARIQEKVKSKTNSQLAAVCQSAFFCLYVSD